MLVLRLMGAGRCDGDGVVELAVVCEDGADVVVTKLCNEIF